MSVFGMSRYGSSFSVLDVTNLGSSLSLRAFVRMGSCLSLAGSLGVGYLQKLKFTDNDGAGFYLKDVTDGTAANSEVLLGSTQSSGFKGMTFGVQSGVLHGLWNSDSTVSTSDRRLKKDIAPLGRAIQTVMDNYDAKVPQTMTPRQEQEQPTKLRRSMWEAAPENQAPGTPRLSRGDSALWLLRQLRPVSYSFRKGAESKYMRFGFIADELETVVPSVVRNVGSHNGVVDQKGVQYQDLIALMAQGVQEEERRTSQMENSFKSRMSELRAELQLLKEEVEDEDEEEYEPVLKRMLRELREKRARERLRREANLTSQSSETYAANASLTTMV